MINKIKRILKKLKHSYNINDYDIIYIFYGVESYDFNNRERVLYVDWKAEIYGWKEMVGVGSTRYEAYHDLEKIFEDYKKKNSILPPPTRHQSHFIATTIPLSFDRLSMYSDIAADFLPRILNYNLEDCWISEHSTLWHFAPRVEEEEIFTRILHEYGVDVSDIENGNLLSIFDRLYSEL